MTIAMSENALQQVSEEIASIFLPLRQLDSEDRVNAFFLALGYQLPVGQSFGNITKIIQKTEDLVTAIEQLAGASTDDEKWNAVVSLLEKIVAVVSEISTRTDELKTELNVIPNFVTNSEIDKLPKRLLDYLLSYYLWQYHKGIYGVTFFIGLLDEIDKPEDVGKFQPAFKLRAIHWERLPEYFTEPDEIPELLYQWNSDFDSELFINRLYFLFRSFQLPGGLYPQSEKVRTALNSISIDLQELRTPIFENARWPDIHSQFGINVSPVEERGSNKAGFAIIPYVFGATSFDFDISEKLKIIFESTASIDAGFGIIVRPDSDVKLITNLFDAPLDSVDFSASLKVAQRENTGEIVIVGSPNATRFAIEGLSTKIFALKNQSSSNKPDVGFEVELEAIRLIVSGGDGDGFLAKLLGDNGINVEAGLTFGFSHASGFYIRGSGGLEIKLATHISIGPITIQEAIIGLKFKDGNLGLDAGATIKAELGPFTAIVENMGLTSTLSFPDKGGNLGPADLAFSFKPPTGIGLSLDTPAVRGGGYLFFDPDNERYGGALELSISNMFMVTAVGLVTTRLPDGSKGFSLLLIINVQFTPGIALGYGFFLSGLGGLIGINRTINEQALIDGVRSGSLDSILFPENIVANITKIISDIRLIFPPKRDQFMIGLMAKITWGVPALVSIEFGIIIEFKSPTRLAILGILQVALPTEEEALIIIKVSFAGIINFDEQYLSFDASLFGSRILTFTLEGDMALRLNWGDEAAFLMTVGGFHPAFEPPARFNLGNLKRLTLNILTGNPRLSLTTYFALTSNTVQFGALIDFYFKVSKFKAIAFFGFDVLFIFSPFRFIAEIRAGVAIKLGSTTLLSISLQFSLAGPTPWNAAGTGSFKILFFKVKVRFSKTWGDRKDILPTKVPVLPEILSALEQNRNWTAELPHRRFMLVTLRELDSEADGIVLQSYGSLTVSQTILPLDMEINKFGNNLPSDIERARISRMRIEDDEVDIDDVRDSFAPSAFTEMKDEDKLKSSSYVKERSGVRVRETDRIYVNHAIGRKVEYEVRTSDFDRKSDTPYELFTPLRLNRITEDGRRFRLAALGGAVGRSDLARELRVKTTRRKVQLTSDLFSIAGMDNLKIFSDTTFTAGTEAEAHDHLKRIIKEKPDLEGKLQVTAEYQLAI